MLREIYKKDCEREESMNTNEIYIKNGTQYKEMTKELLTQCNLAAQIFDTDMQIGIKPNLVAPSGFLGSYYASGDCGGDY